MSFLARMVPNFSDYDTTFRELGTAGYTLAINISNTTPELYHTTYPEEWIREYTENKYAFLDPVMQFAAFSSGVKRWGEVTSLKIPIVSNKVYERARSFNLSYGGAIVVRSASGRRRKHVCSVARGDRELTDEELIDCASSFEAFLSELHPEDHLTDRMIAILRILAQGSTIAETANRLNVSSETIKKDMDKVRQMWGARNATEAVAMAVSRRIINLSDTPIW